MKSVLVTDPLTTASSSMSTEKLRNKEYMPSEGITGWKQVCREIVILIAIVIIGINFGKPILRRAYLLRSLECPLMKIRLSVCYVFLENWLIIPLWYRALSTDVELDNGNKLQRRQIDSHSDWLENRGCSACDKKEILLLRDFAFGYILLVVAIQDMEVKKSEIFLPTGALMVWIYYVCFAMRNWQQRQPIAYGRICIRCN